MWRTASTLTRLDWLAAIEATWRLALARGMIVLLRFPNLAKRLGTPMRESVSDDDLSRKRVLRRIRWAIAAISRRAPWRCKCLEQAIAAKMMLRARNIDNTLYLGVARDSASASSSASTKSSAVEAHAWLRCGSVYVTGGEERGRFTVVSMFADERET
jgi:hypothetical protein